VGTIHTWNRTLPNKFNQGSPGDRSLPQDRCGTHREWNFLCKNKQASFLNFLLWCESQDQLYRARLRKRETLEDALALSLRAGEAEKCAGDVGGELGKRERSSTSIIEYGTRRLNGAPTEWPRVVRQRLIPRNSLERPKNLLLLHHQNLLLRPFPTKATQLRYQRTF
jgi:hypothetical protein